MKKMLIVDPEKCTGCRICESACALFHTRTCNPARSRIKVIKWEKEGIDVPMLCQHCAEAFCVNVCPVNAIRMDEKIGALSIDYNVCRGCKMCMIACPFGGISVDFADEKIIKCDLCSGDPRCAKFCPTKAIEYTRADKAGTDKKRKGAEQIGKLVSLLMGVEEKR